MKTNLVDKGFSVRGGFTLIELLIVVAIIAILAAIAVPNFLEAQTRAKVSRAKADMRTLATAIEAYNLDHNRPPIGLVEAARTLTPQNWGLGFGRNRTLKMWSQVTTPVAYISAVPDDSFRLKNYIAFDGNVSFDNPYFDYDHFRFEPMDGNAQVALRNGINWLIVSFGPDRNQGTFNPASGYPHPHVVVGNLQSSGASAWTSVPASNGIYDPTNGTISDGHIIRTNAGDASDGAHIRRR